MLNVKKKRRIVPAAITMSNLLAGCLATMNAFSGDLWAAGCFILLGAFFDFFDGMTARKLRVSSEFGGQLDSLADLVTFGFAPAAICMSILQDMEYGETIHFAIHKLILFSPLMMVVASAKRLATFNVEEHDESDDFSGLPTLANALFWVGIGWHVISQKHSFSAWWASITRTDYLESQTEGSPHWIADFMSLIYSSHALMIGLMVLFSYLMVSQLPMLAFKSGWNGVKKKASTWILLLSTAASAYLFKEASLAIIIAVYLILSLATALLNKKDH